MSEYTPNLLNAVSEFFGDNVSCLSYPAKSLLPNKKDTFSGVDVEVHFSGIKEHYLDLIRTHDAVFGCVAWLTDGDFLYEASKKRSAFVIQKEDFLRDDGVARDRSFKNYIRSKYSKLKGTEKHFFHNALSSMSYCGDPGLDGVSCFGMSEKSMKRPNMHHKFLVFCDTEENESHVPKVVTTGSYNITANARNSLENIVTIKSEEVAEMYYQWFGAIASMSEPLDWKNEYINPRWRIGS
jgi:hypothetical protein